MLYIVCFEFNTRNTLDCDQPYYSSRIVFSHIPFNLVKWIGRPFAEKNGRLKFPQYGPNERSVGRRSVAGRWLPVGPQYILLLILI